MLTENRKRILLFLFAIAMIGALAYKLAVGVADPTGDFAVFWYSGRSLNLSLDPYKFNSAVQVSGIPNVMHFWSPIWLAELMRPFGLLSYHVAKAVWTLINLALFVLVVWMIAKLSRIVVRFESFVLLCAVMLSLNSTIYTLGDGQTDLVVVASLVTSWLLLSRKKLFLSGAVLCIGAINPHLIIGTAVYFTFRSIRYKEPQLFLGGLTGLALLAIVSAPYHNYIVEWFGTILPYAQSQGVTDPAGQLTLVNLFHGMHVWAASFWVVVLSSIALVLAVTTWLTISDIYIAMGVSTCLTLLTSTFAFHQDFLILALAIPSIVRLWNISGLRTVPLICALSMSVLCSGMTGNITSFNHSLFEVFQPLVALAVLFIIVPSLWKLRPVERAIILMWICVTVGGCLICNLYPIQAHRITEALVLSGLFISLWTITYHFVRKQIIQNMHTFTNSFAAD